MAPSHIACVTGASGFIGTHVVRELVSRGHTVRATVRDATSARKTDHVRAAVGDTDRLSFHTADLLEPGAFDEIVAGCDVVYHIASAVRLAAPDPQRDIVDVAVQGTDNVLSAIARSDSVRAIGLTSSIAAVMNTGPNPGHVYTEDDWCEDATLATNPYGLGKVTAERRVWNFAREHELDLVVVNPGLVLGPVHSKAHVRSSATVVRDILTRAYPANPRIGLNIVDVRDVAELLVNGIERRASGRYILVKEAMWVRDLAERISAAFPQYDVSTRTLWSPLLYAYALVSKHLSWQFLRNNIGRLDRFDSSKAEDELGPMRPIEQTIVDTCRSLVDNAICTPRQR